MNAKKKVGILGASGYTGAELLRLLAGHDGKGADVFIGHDLNGFKHRRVGGDGPGLRPFVGEDFIDDAGDHSGSFSE